ncbi:MAG: DUF2244 domain-containing protein, partial [Burkholderiaceae bacterium]
VLSSSDVSVEVVQGRQRLMSTVSRDWLRVEWPGDRTSLVSLRSGKQVVPLGRFVDQACRRQFVEDLKRVLVAVPT